MLEQSMGEWACWWRVDCFDIEAVVALDIGGVIVFLSTQILINLSINISIYQIKTQILKDVDTHLINLGLHFVLSFSK